MRARRVGIGRTGVDKCIHGEDAPMERREGETGLRRGRKKMMESKSFTPILFCLYDYRNAVSLHSRPRYIIMA